MRTAVKDGVSPIASGSALHTHVMKTLALKQALDRHGIDAAIGGARRDEEKSRAKERVFSLRSAGHGWNPRAQRPELWNVFNTRLGPGESMRVFPLSDWTELDVWEYIAAENIPVVPLYFAAERPVVERNGTWIMVDDDRLPLEPGEQPQLRRIRFRTLGCYPLSGRHRIRCRHRRGHHRRVTQQPLFRTARPADRSRQHGVDGAKEEGGVLLMHGATPLRQKRLLRFFMGGSVDDGKSTLIGRLLHETGSVADDELAALTRDWRASATAVRRSILRCWSMAWRTSANRALPSTLPTAIFRRRAAASSSPIRRATKAIPATPRAAPRTPISPSFWSMRGGACCRRRAGTP